MKYSEIIINPDLPIAAFEEEIIQKFETSTNMIIIGETGSGKTTQIPLMLLKSLSKVQDLIKGKIAVTEPRRLAATSVAEYLSASALHEDLGRSIGYKIRFTDTTSDNSVLIFMTDGIMLREAQLDPLLSKYSVVMVDEAHERNINSDFLIGLLVDIQKRRKEKGLIPLKIIVTSATLEKEKFEDYFNSIPDEPLGIVEVPGRLFPITTFFSKKNIYDYEREAAKKVEEICYRSGTKAGDILIFMPGKREIEKTKEEIEALPNFENLNLEIISVHANLTIDQQNQIFKKTNKRKVVIATNIAETSLTVPGIIHVVDSGLIKQMNFDPHSGMNSLKTHYHSRKGLEQRKGRGGRIEPGFYYPLFTEASFKERSEFQRPEILRTSLTQVILIMKKIGIEDIEHFKFIDQPDFKLIENAIKELQRYNALDRFENLTEKGEIMANLPIEPRLSNLILEADKNKCVESICTIASFLELKPVIVNLNYEEILKKLIELHTSSDAFKSKFNAEDLENMDDLSSLLTFEELEELQRIAIKEFKRYKVTISQLQNKSSDFFTILNIFYYWVKNNMEPGWAEHNYLSPETLDEATNIREELLDIVKNSGYSTEDKNSKDLYEKIERTLISAFKFNILSKQRNGFYQRIKSKDSGIRLHNSSALMESKPDYVVAYEVIEINEIDSEPKLSAKFLHAVNEDTIRRLFPDTFKRNRRDKERYRNSKRRFKFKRR